MTHLTSVDVVRHPLVARIVDAYDARNQRGDEVPPNKPATRKRSTS
jgi:phosphate starvation-inducible PhoH-like protein